jgi:hypothetical protein
MREPLEWNPFDDMAQNFFLCFIFPTRSGNLPGFSCFLGKHPSPILYGCCVFLLKTKVPAPPGGPLGIAY